VRALVAVPLLVAALTPFTQTVNQQQAAVTPVKPASAEAAAPEQLKIILLRPSVHFEDVRSGVSSDFGVPTARVNRRKKTGAPEGDYERLLLDAARSAVGSKARALDSETVGPDVAEVCSKLEPLASRLARGNVNDEAISDLTKLASLDKHYAVLVQFFRLETGPGRSWDPNTGAITSSSDSTLIQAALISSETGKVAWRGERLIRNKALKPADAALSKALQEMYRNFDIR